VDCKDGCGILKVNVPWARPGSGFTLLFDNKVMVLSREMPIATLGRICNEHDTKLWRIINHYVEQGLKKNDFSMVNRIGVDETAAQRGHKYITSFIDLDTGKLLFATPGKGKETVKASVQDLKNHGGNPDLISEVCCDLSPSFIAGIKDNLPSAAKTIKNHWDGVLNWYNSKVSNGILEGTNSLLQARKSKARDYRKTATFITMS
jgi:transposase